MPPSQAQLLLELLDVDHATPTLVWNDGYRGSLARMVTHELRPMQAAVGGGGGASAHGRRWDWRLEWEFEFETLPERFAHEPAADELKVRRNGM